ncbi:GTPase-activating protein [Sphagnurus paluster]|uniref:GTPase-activating protein n=1 Tax=Sphagnurus paluster TaxID=117069 RepID=A0A9P7G0D2_9AGAR|nr:GTPase-activating protein [Sphagnurus paluster]
MTARSPPARPHIGIHPSNHFGRAGDWGEDDAWDSGSDSESPRQSSITKALSRPSAPRPVPKSTSNSSSSTLAFSYTHVSAPNPSSYSPREDTILEPKSGWTIVKKAKERGIMEDGTPEQGKESLDQVEGRGDADVEGDMILGDLESEVVALDQTPPPALPPHLKAKHGHGVIRNDVDEIVHGTFSVPLLGYLPLPTPLRATTLARKRGEYLSLVEVAFARDRVGLDQQIWHQIEIDVPRTRPGVRLWMHGATQRSLERILYVWAIRHPASGYVQGINDLVTPFFQVFLSAYIDSDPENFDPSLLPTNVLNAVEADSFWCLSRLLDGIQDNYIFAQPGIQRSVRRMAELVARIDVPLSAHLESQNVEFMQFAFRWMNCLLMREISVQNTIRMWDTYLAEGPDAFSQFHLYVCSAFLVRWSEKLRQMDFQGIIMFLQSLPTQDWGDHEIEMLLSEAFVLNSIWQNAQSHFSGK